MASNKNREFNVLYTHQKIKKSKRWQDGLLRVSPQGTRAILFDDKKSKLDTVYVKPEQVLVGEELESDRFLITIEEEKLTERTRNDNEVTNVRVEVPLQQQPQQREVPLQQQPQQREVPLQPQPQQREVPLQQQPQQREVPLQPQPQQQEVPLQQQPQQREVPLQQQPQQRDVPLQQQPQQREVPLQQQPQQREVPLQQQPQQREVPLQQQPQQREVPLQQQHQQPQWHQQSYHLQQEVFQNQKSMPLKRKRTGFTVPRQACKKVATESEVLPSKAVTNLPGKPMDSFPQTTLFSASFKTIPDAKLGTDVYSVYDGIGEGNLYNTSVDGEMSNNKDGQSSEIDAILHSLPSYQTVANLQENMSTVTPEINDSFTPHCFSADTPKSDPRFICTPCFGNLDTSGTNLSQSNFSVERTDILTERVGFNNQNILQERSEDSPNSYNTNQSAIPAERRSASQILALLGKGKAKFKPPMKHPESEPKVAEIETQLANHNEELSSSLLQATQKLPPFENSSPREFGDDVDVMTLLGQANVDSSSVSYTNVSNEPSHESTDRRCAYGPEMLVKKECRYETAQGQSSVEIAESPNTANLQRFGDFNAVTNTVEKAQDVEQESDFSSINNIVHQKQKSQSQGQDQDLESEEIDDCGSLENGSKNDRNKDDQDDRKLDNINQGDWQIDSMDQDSGNLDSGDQGDENQIDRNQIDRNQIDRNQIDRNQIDRNQVDRNQVDRNQVDRNQVDRNQVDRNQIDRNQVGSNQDYGNEDDRNKTERAPVNRNKDDILYLDNRNKDVGNQGDGNQVTMNQDNGIWAHENQEHRDQDGRNLDDRNHSERNMSDAIQNDKFQDGRNQDDRHQDDRNWDDGNQDGRDRDDENQEDRSQDKNQDDRNQDDRNQYDSNWNDGNQDDCNRDVGNQDGRNWDDENQEDRNQDKNQDDRNQDDRNQYDSNWDDGNQDVGKLEDRNQDKNQDDRNQDDRNQYDSNWDDGNQEDRNQDKNQDDRNQDDRNQYDSNWNDGNQDDWNRDVGNQDGRNWDDENQEDRNQDKNQDDRNQDDRNQYDSNWDDGNQDVGKLEDRNQDKNQGDRNQDDRNPDDSNWDDRNRDDWNQDDNNQANQSQDLSCSQVKSETCISSAVAYISVNTDVECSEIIVQSKTANEKIKAKNTVLSSVAQANKKAEQCVLQDKDLSQRDSDEVVKNVSNGTEYVSWPAPNTGTDTQTEKIVCTLCGALLLSAQVMCAECADQIAVGLESSWKSGSQITDTTQLSQEMQDESAKEQMMQSEMQQVDDEGGYCVAPSDNSFCLISREESGKSISNGESNIGDSPQYGTLSMDSIISVNDQLVPGQDDDKSKGFEEFFKKPRMLQGGKCESLESKEQEITLRICNNQLEFVPMKTASRVVDEMSPFDETTFQLADKRTSTSCLLENQLHNAGRSHYPQRIIDDKLGVGNKVSSLIPTSSYESPLPNEKSLAVVNEGKASLFDKENLHEEWLTRIERLTCPEVEDSSDSVVPEITALLPQIENQDLESFKELDNRIEENKDSLHIVTNQSLSHQCTQNTNEDCDVGEQCVPVQRESLSEEDASIQDECDTPSDEEWLRKITSSSSFLPDTTNSETRGYEVSPPCTYVPNRHSAVTNSVNSRTADGSLSGKCSDALHYLPTKWKAVAKRYKNTTVSQNVEWNHSDMQSSVISNNQTRTQDVLNTSEDHIDVLHTCQESHEVCGYPNRWQGATRKKQSDGATLMPSSKASHNSRWIKDTSSGDTSEDTSSVLGRWRDSNGRNLFEIVNQSLEQERYESSPTLQSQISNPERRHFSGRMEYLPWSEGQGGSPHLNMYEAETHYQGLGSETAKQSRTQTFRCCEASDTCGGLRLGSSTTSVTQRLSPRCWPMFPGYSQQYAELDESFGRQPESPEDDVIMEGNIHVDSSRCESVGLDHEWKLQSYFHEEDPSSGVQCLKQQSDDEFDGSHDLSLMLMPIDTPSGPYSLLHPPQLKRSLVDDVNIIRADEDTPRSSDKETNKKKMENYWNNPVSSGTVRRELDTPTIFQASARRKTLSVSTKTRGTCRAPSLNLVEGLPFGREDHHPFLNGKHRNVFQLQEDESPSLHPWSGLGNKQPSCVMQRDIIESLTDDELAFPRPQRRIGNLYPSQAIGAGDDQLGSYVHEKTLYSGSVVHPEVDSDVKPRSNSPMYPSYQQRTSNNILHQQWTSDNILNPNSVQCLFPSSPIPTDLPSAEDKSLTDAWRAEFDNTSKNESQGYLSTGNYPTSDTKNKKLYHAADKTSYSGSCLRTPQRLLHLQSSESVETFGLQCKELMGSRTCFNDQKQSGPEQNLSLPSWLRRCNRRFHACLADVYQSLYDGFEAGITSEESSQTRPNSPPFITRQDTPYTPCMADGISSNHERREFTEGASSHHVLASKHPSGRGRSFQTPMITVTGQSALSSGRSICGELFFPSADEVQGVASLKRQVQIPASFTSVANYKQVFTSALKEHLNIVLFELSQRYHSAKDKADVQYLDASIQSGECPRVSNVPRCDHGNPAKMVCVKKDGANKGRFFYACSAPRANQCKFFLWANQFKGNPSNTSANSGLNGPTLTDPTAATMYFKSYNVHLYYGCEFQRRTSSYDKLMPGAPAWIRKHKQRMLDSAKTKLYLRLSRKESSSTYGKDDIWVISKDLTFDPRSTFLARSIYHGPSSNNDIEVQPLSGYSASNWTSICTVHALLACNASSELTCLSNIQEYVNARTVPILQAVLNNSSEAPSVVQSKPSAFKSPAGPQSNFRQLDCSIQDIEKLATDMIERYKLNTDQAAALRRVSKMFQLTSAENSNTEPVTLIHGVFGAGKSFLLAVTVLFLNQLFELSDVQNPNAASQQLPWKLLIASTTNVAVDRILLGLLGLGFEDFIRVGSIKKIAKPVLPYSVHASDKKDSREIQDLYEMLKTDLTPTEKIDVRRSIERQRLGMNKDLLGSVRVVGVTCAACTFPCMSSLGFSVILLDECSQMTEPSSLLPIARFQCEKLVLVGDPKQLDPTIQGTEAAHGKGLEQTLFNRLIQLGYEPILLRTQYRCHPEISSIANNLFYDQQLIDGVTAEDRPPLAPSLPTLCFYSVSNGQECCASDGSYYNDPEASFVIFLIETLVLLGVEPADIGVITLYKAQTVKINVLLQGSKLSTQNSLKAIQISTVDAFQGGEKGVIILSCVRTDYMGFADSDKRTNVALTRSKSHLFIVGNLRILSANSLWGKVIDKCKDSNSGIQSSRAFIKQWTPRMEEILQEQAKKGRNRSKRGTKTTNEEQAMRNTADDSLNTVDNSAPSSSQPRQTSPHYLTSISQVEASKTEEVKLERLHSWACTPHGSSPSYSPLPVMEESEGDTSLNEEPCFDIGDLQGILE